MSLEKEGFIKKQGSFGRKIRERGKLCFGAMGDLEKQERVGENERLLEGMPVLDFDMLCSSVALQSAHGSWGKLGGGDEEQQGGVLRMWEGELLDCFDDFRSSTTLIIVW